MKRTISFHIGEKEYVDFKIKLRHDGLSQQKLLGRLVEFYINNPSFFEIVLKEVMELDSSFSKSRVALSLDAYSEGIKNVAKYSMSEEEKEQLYSLLEEENGDL